MGNPVVVVPAGRSRDGLPVGLQLVGRRWDDMTLVALAQAVARVLGTEHAPVPPGWPAGNSG